MCNPISRGALRTPVADWVARFEVLILVAGQDG